MYQHFLGGLEAVSAISVIRNKAQKEKKKATNSYTKKKRMAGQLKSMKALKSSYQILRKCKGLPFLFRRNIGACIT